MPTRVVTLSHATGAGGEAIGRSVAQQLGFRYLDEEIIELAAQKEGLDVAVVADAERRKSFLERLFAGLGEPAVSIAMLTPEAVMSRGETVRPVIVEAIHAVAGRGQAVIVSHAASIPLAGRPDALRVLVTASADTRAQRVVRDGQSEAGDATRFIKDNDAGRADYLRRFYGIDRELSTHYDLVINTDVLSAEEAADIVVAAARRRA